MYSTEFEFIPLNLFVFLFNRDVLKHKNVCVCLPAQPVQLNLCCPYFIGVAKIHLKSTPINQVNAWTPEPLTPQPSQHLDPEPRTPEPPNR